MGNITRFDPFNELARSGPLRDMSDLLRGFMLHPILRDLGV